MLVYEFLMPTSLGLRKHESGQKVHRCEPTLCTTLPLMKYAFGHILMSTLKHKSVIEAMS